MEENKRPILLAGWQKDFLETVQKKVHFYR